MKAISTVGSGLKQEDKRCCSGETVQENRVKMLSGLKIQTAHYVFLYIMFKYANEAI